MCEFFNHIEANNHLTSLSQNNIREVIIDMLQMLLFTYSQELLSNSTEIYNTNGNRCIVCNELVDSPSDKVGIDSQSNNDIIRFNECQHSAHHNCYNAWVNQQTHSCLVCKCNVSFNLHDHVMQLTDRQNSNYI